MRYSRWRPFSVNFLADLGHVDEDSDGDTD